MDKAHSFVNGAGMLSLLTKGKAMYLVFHIINRSITRMRKKCKPISIYWYQLKALEKKGELIKVYIKDQIEQAMIE